MRTVHLLRKYDAQEWGGTESAVNRLLHGLSEDGIESVVYCPQPRHASEHPPGDGKYAVKYFKACVPVWGLTRQQKRQFVSVGGNLFSFDLLPALWIERNAQLIHTHTLGRLGAIAAAVAQRRHIPLVVTIHGGFLDLPKPLKDAFHTPSNEGFDWGRIFGFLLKSREMLEHADAILTCNPTEAALLRERFPKTRVQVQPHGISVAAFQEDCRPAALEAWPQLRDRKILLSVGRIDPVKNQSWLLEQAPRIFEKHPDATLVFAGPPTDDAYDWALRRQINGVPNPERILLTGGLSPGDKRLTGLFQLATALVLSSVSETFGLVLLEAWAARTSVISSRTSGAKALVRSGDNGWLFDLNDPASFHHAVDSTLNNSERRAQMVAAGNTLVRTEYDLPVIARQTRQLYHQLIEAKTCTM